MLEVRAFDRMLGPIPKDPALAKLSPKKRSPVLEDQRRYHVGSVLQTGWCSGNGFRGLSSSRKVAGTVAGFCIQLLGDV